MIKDESFGFSILTILVLYEMSGLPVIMCDRPRNEKNAVISFDSFRYSHKIYWDAQSRSWSEVS